MFVHANLLKEMPRSEFNPQHEQGVFRVFKDYTLVQGNTWLHPQMQTSQRTLYSPDGEKRVNASRPCMELFGGNGEPDIRERPFEELPGLERFNDFYRRNGGLVYSLLIICKLMYREEELMIYQSCRIFCPAMTMVRAAINQFMASMSVIYTLFSISPTWDTHSINQSPSVSTSTVHGSISYSITHPTRSEYNHCAGGWDFRYL